MGTILAIGNDDGLLTSRAALLRRVTSEVTASGYAAAVELLKIRSFDLVVLCHTLSLKQTREITALCDQKKPKAPILKIVAVTLP